MMFPLVHGLIPVQEQDDLVWYNYLQSLSADIYYPLDDAYTYYENSQQSLVLDHSGNDIDGRLFTATATNTSYVKYQQASIVPADSAGTSMQTIQDNGVGATIVSPRSDDIPAHDEDFSISFFGYFPSQRESTHGLFHLSSNDGAHAQVAAYVLEIRLSGQDSANYPRFTVYRNINSSTVDVAIDDSTPHHLAATVNGSTNTVKLYLDGALILTHVGATPVSRSERWFVLGGLMHHTNIAPSNCTRGYYQHFQLWRNTILTADEIAEIYNYGMDGVPALPESDATPPTIPVDPDPTLLEAGIATTANTRGRVFCGLKRAIAIGCDSLFTWGKTDKFQGTTPAGDDYIQVALSERSLSAALKTSGEASVWGQYTYLSNSWATPKLIASQPDPSTLYYSAPDPVLDAVQMASVSVLGSQYLYFLISDGSVFAVNSYGDEIASGAYAAPAGTFTAISSGYAAAAGILDDGTVVAWGGNADSECDVPVDLADVIEVDGGDGFFIALSSDGTVTHWGSTANDVDDIPVFASTPVNIAAGYNHCIAVLANGAVVGWGDDTYGQASPPASLTNAVRAFGGSDFSIAVMNDGKLAGWGRNDYQQATGHSHQAIICNDGPPADAVPGTQKLALAGIDRAVLALKYDGTLIGWENSSNSGLFPLPINLPTLSAVVIQSHSSGGGYFVGLDGDGKLRTTEAYRQSGHPYLAGSSDPDAKAIAICKQIYWGVNVLSDTGVPYVFSNDNNRPPTLPTMIAFETGYGFKIALSAIGGVVYAWGNDKQGGLSMPDEAGRVMQNTYNGYSWGLSGITQISLLYELCAALKSDGSLAVWGNDNGYGALTVPDDLPIITEVQCGWRHIVALDEDGAVHCWGDNRSGQCDVPSDLGLVESVFANAGSTYVVLRDGTIRGWGYNVNIPAGINLND